jgi:pimeloyl-ACP methyl ester carboxylesterase
VLVGTSFGGATAGTFAARHPDRVRALVLVGSVGLAPMPSETRQRIRDRVGDASVEGVRTKLRTLLIDESLVTDAFVREEHKINSSPGAEEAFEALGAYMAEDVERDIVVDRLAEVGDQVPVLLLWGELDRTFPVSVAEEAAAKIPGSRLVLIRNAGHAPYYERADAFNGVLTDFLAGELGRFQSGDVDYR